MDRYYFTRIFLLILSFQANASEIELTISPFGQNNGDWGGNGAWDQSGQPNELHRGGKALAVHLSFEQPGLEWIRHSIGGRYVSGTHAYNGTFVSDYCHQSGMFQGGPMSAEHAMAECDFRYTVRSVKTRTTSLTYTMTPTWEVTQNLSLSVGLGVSFFKHITTVVSGENHSFPIGTKTKYENVSLSRYAEVGIEYKGYSVKYYHAGEEDGPESPDLGNSGYLFGYTLKF